MENKGKLIIFSGVSGVGKSSILKELFKDESLNLTFSVSMTTRPKRFDEIEGVNYFFVSKQDFESEIQNGNLLEYQEFCGNLYGTPKKFVEKKLEEGFNVILEIEVKGASNVMKMMPDAISIFVLPPDLEELKRRLEGRGTESDNAIYLRLRESEKELRYKENYKYVVINDDLNSAVEEIKKIIKNETKK